MVKCVFLLLERGKLIKVVEFLSRIYEQHETRENGPAFHAFNKTQSKCLKTVFVFYVITFIGTMYVPLAISVTTYVLYDDRQLPIPIYIPGLLLEHANYYKLNLIVQLVLGERIVAVYMYFDVVFVLQLIHVILMADIVCNGIRTMEMALLGSQPSQVDVSTRLRGVIQMQNELRE